MPARRLKTRNATWPLRARRSPQAPRIEQSLALLLAAMTGSDRRSMAVNGPSTDLVAAGAESFPASPGAERKAPIDVAGNWPAVKQRPTPLPPARRELPWIRAHQGPRATLVPRAHSAPSQARREDSRPEQEQAGSEFISPPGSLPPPAEHLPLAERSAFRAGSAPGSPPESPALGDLPFLEARPDVAFDGSAAPSLTPAPEQMLADMREQLAAYAARAEDERARREFLRSRVRLACYR